MRESLVDPQLRRLLSSSAVFMGQCSLQRELLNIKKRKGTRVSCDNFLLLRKATFTVFKQDFLDKINIACVALKLLHTQPMHLPEPYLTRGSSVIAEF